MIRAVYPGTFDPLTNGHFDIIERSLKFVDELIIAPTNNLSKNIKLPADDRVKIIKKATEHFEKVRVKPFRGLLVDFMKEEEATFIIRGLRAISDFEYEMQMAIINTKLYDDYEVIFLMPKENNSFLSSSVVREIAKLGGDLTKLVPAKIIDIVVEKYS